MDPLTWESLSDRLDLVLRQQCEILTALAAIKKALPPTLIIRLGTPVPKKKE